jgi:hypothetical protein
VTSRSSYRGDCIVRVYIGGGGGGHKKIMRADLGDMFERIV